VTILVLLAEDQTMFRTATRRLLELEPDIKVVAEVDSGERLLEAALSTNPDVALVDIEMPGKNSFEAVHELHERLPSCRTLIVTTFGRPGYFRRAMAAGAVGFVLKDRSVDALVAAIRRCVTGEAVIDPGLAAVAMREGYSPLTSRERDVLAATRSGAPIAEIAHELCMSEGTVRNRISNAIAKLGARNRTDAVRIATEHGWL
jgi:two-component system, NarL family, response regulator DesR